MLYLRAILQIVYLFFLRFIYIEYGKYFIFIYIDIAISFWLTDFYLLHQHVILETSVMMRKNSLWDPFVSIHPQQLTSKAT